MSTVTPGRPYAEFDEYIDYQIQKTRRGIKATDLITAMCGVAVLVLAYLLVFVVCDHWLVAGGFSHGMRLLLLGGLVLVAGGWTVWRVVLPAFRQVSRLYAARSLESIAPELQSTLLNYVDLKSAGRSVSPAVLASLEKRAAVTLSRSETEDAIDRRPVLVLSYVLLALVTLFSAYVVFSPRKVWPSVWRALVPGSEIQVSTRTEIVSIRPDEDSEVLARSHLEVSVDLRGELPPAVMLYYSTADRGFVDEPVRMDQPDSAVKTWRCILTGENGQGLLQDLTWRIEAGDAVSRTYRVTVVQPPSANVTGVRYQFPDYMEEPPHELPRPDIDAWEGTQLTVLAESTVPVASAWMQFSDEEQFPERCEEIRMTVGGDGRKLTAAWQPLLRADGSHPRYYRIQCQTAKKMVDPAPAIHPVVIRADQKPDFVTVLPKQDLEVPANIRVPFFVQARDPDFRLTSLILKVQNGTRPVVELPLFKGLKSLAEGEHVLDLEAFGARPGDVLTWWVEARDNRLVELPGRRLLEPNLKSTARLKITIQQPVDPAVAQQQSDEKQREQRQQREPASSDSGAETEPASSGERSGDPAGEEMPPEGRPEAGPREQTPPEKPGSTDRSEGGSSGSSSSGKTSDDKSGKSGSGAGEKDGSDNQTGKGSGEKPQPDGSQPGKGTERTPDARQPGDRSGSEGRKPDRPESAGGSDSANDGKKNGDTPRSKDGGDDDSVLKELLERFQSERQKNGSQSGAESKVPSTTDNSKPQDRTSGDGASGNKPDASGMPQSEDSAEQTPETGASKPDGTGQKAADETPRDSRQPNDSADKPGSKPAPESGSDGVKKPSPEGMPGGSGKPVADDMPSSKGMPPEKGSSESGTSNGTSGPSEKPADTGKADGRPETTSGDKQPGTPTTTPNRPDQKRPGNMTDGKGGEPSDAAPEKSEPQSPGGSDGKGRPSQPGNSPNQESRPGADGSDSAAKPGRENGSPGTGSEKPSGQSANGSSPAKPDGGSPASGSSGSAPPNSTGSSSDSKPMSDGRPAPSSSPSSGGESGKPADDDSGMPGQPGGDSANKPGTPSKSPGQNSSSNEASQGEGSQNPESPMPSGTPKSGGSKTESGQPGGAGAQSEDGGKGSGPSGESGASSSGGESTSGSQSGKPGSGGKSASGTASSRPAKQGGNRSAGGIQEQNDGAGGSSGSGSAGEVPEQADEAVLEDRLNATNLVLKKLQEELDRGEVDGELLQKLGWTEADMKRFVERMQRQVRNEGDDPSAQARRRQFEEMLKSLNLKSSGSRREAGDAPKQSATDFTDRRVPPPVEYRRQFEELTRRLSGQRREEATPPGR